MIKYRAVVLLPLVLAITPQCYCQPLWDLEKNVDCVGSGTVPGKWYPVKADDESACQAAATQNNVSIFSFNYKSKHCYLRQDGVWQTVPNDHTMCGCIYQGPGVVHGCPVPAPPPPPPAPAKGFKHVSITSPTPQAPLTRGTPAGAGIQSTFYFLPIRNVGPAVLTTFNVATSTWGNLSIPADSGVMSMFNGVSFASVADTTNNFLVVSGGGTNAVVAYNLGTGNWTHLPGLQHKIANSCSMGCDGLWYTMTGDMVKDGAAESALSFKPANRQIYAYNLSSGQAMQNNGEKTRGGAGCACGERAGVVFFAGGFSDAGVTSGVEVWRFPLARRGEPKLDMGNKKRDMGGVGCGGWAVFAGGDDGKTQYNSVEVWNTVLNISDPSTLAPRVFKLAKPLVRPKLGCLAGRYAIVGGGLSGAAPNADVYVFDTAAQPSPGSVLPFVATLNTSGVVALAAASSAANATAIGFFDGATLDMISLA
eukprot:m.14078 g.14078  ORF g.14078 m.14078 type:complete len:479 (+) comp10298_c0_seq2:141-1577(+)